MNTKLLSIAAVAGLLVGSTALVQAQTRGGPGASGASPGHEMQRQGSRGGPGASRFAPDHNKATTGAGARDDRIPGERDDRTTGFGGHDGDDDFLRHDTDGRMMDDDRRGVDKE